MQTRPPPMDLDPTPRTPLERALTRISMAQNGRGWDLDPELYQVCWRDREAGTLHVKRMPTTTAFWAQAPRPYGPVQVLAHYANALRDELTRLSAGAPVELAGWVFTAESWMTRNVHGPAAWEQIERARRNRTLDQDPRRVEVRLTAGRLVTGEHREVFHYRLADLSEIVRYDPACEFRAAGQLVEALETLCGVIPG